MNKSVFILLLCACLTIGALPNQSQAYAYADKSERRAKSISAKQAANIVKSRFGGKVLKVSSSGDGYRVKLLKKDGRIISVYVDGISGKIKG